ncbi:MAG TPA: hypothetical protein VIE17_01550 [Methylophilaceae bacterium]|jgi:hypothetical protein
MKLLSIIILCVAVILTGCSLPAVKSEKIEAIPNKIKELDVVIWMGQLPTKFFVKDTDREAYSSNCRKSLLKQLPSIFHKNGILIKSIYIDTSSTGLVKESRELLKNSNSPYLLLLTVRGYTTGTLKSKTDLWSMNFQADLFDTQMPKIVWKSHPSIGLDTNDFDQSTAFFSAQIINGLKKDGLIDLKTDSAVDQEGKIIRGFSHWQIN